MNLWKVMPLNLQRRNISTVTLAHGRFKKTLIWSHLLSRNHWINISHQRLVAQFPQSHGLTPEIRRKIRRKNATHAKAKKTGSAKFRTKFETLRREIKADIRKQHELYVNNLVGDVKANPRDFYRYINSQKKDVQGIPLKKRNGSGLAESDFEKAGEFNGQFTDVFTKTEHSQVPLLNRKAPFMEDIVVSKEGVTKLLKGLNPSKALGPDELHPRVLKELASELGPVFAHLFQQSIDSGEIPKEGSLANICPLFKKADRSLACNYRPVSLTCVPCKLLEHIVCF